MNEKSRLKKLVIILSIILALLLGVVLYQNILDNKKLEDFNKYFNASEEKLIYIAKTGCHYCTLLEPAKASVIDGKIDYFYIDTVDISESVLNKILKKLEITNLGTPTLVIVKNGKVVKKQEGVFSTTTDNVSELTSFLKGNNIIKESE